ncbi:MAG: radical SAM protein [Clostridia bacterium]|nr:radical SAM protein [Clostridia bacterium]
MSAMPVEMVEYIKDKCSQDLDEIEEHEPWNERLKRNVKLYYDRMLMDKPFGAITRQDYERLKQLGLDKIVFDWQAFEETTDNELMGRKGLITDLMSSLIRARQMGLNVYVHFIPMKPNYKQLPDIVECLELSGVKNISILNFVPQGRGRENKGELMLSEEQLKEFSAILKREKEHFSGNIRIGIPLNGRVSHLCTAGTERLDIKYDGTILPCPAFKEISLETMEKYGITLHNIYEDLEKVVVRSGKRAEPLCKQIYGFNGELVDNDSIR